MRLGSPFGTEGPAAVTRSPESRAPAVLRASSRMLAAQGKPAGLPDGGGARLDQRVEKRSPGGPRLLLSLVRSASSGGSQPSPPVALGDGHPARPVALLQLLVTPSQAIGLESGRVAPAHAVPSHDLPISIHPPRLRPAHPPAGISHAACPLVPDDRLAEDQISSVRRDTQRFADIREGPSASEPAFSMFATGRLASRARAPLAFIK